MDILTNMSALNAARQHGINSSNYKKSTEKLSSGYKINRAADNAANLGISEQMRAQIRGLNRSVINADEGANFIQTGDGSMNEIHAMLQRMRELSVQSLNDTNTPEDRAALAQEFNELQSEIDRINRETYFNTQHVFQEHEDSFYQIAGNRHWKADELHTITAPQNDLIINLPDGYGYQPQQYTITVPNGTYTTQELVDEIEDAFLAMNPENPGFVLEFDDRGYCNLNFEDAEGNVTKIKSVDGTLAYLIYDCYSGSPRPDLAGTSIIGNNLDERIEIVKGQNDTLEFYLETSKDKITITIPSTERGTWYTRSELINMLNNGGRDLNDPTKILPGLLNHPQTNGLDLTAEEYTMDNGNIGIQIKNSGIAGVTGLKGNMFTIEHTNGIFPSEIYTGAFYDNVYPGHSTEISARIKGAARSGGSTEPIEIIKDFNDTLHLHFSIDTPDKVYDDNFSFKLEPPGNYNSETIVQKLNEKFAETELKGESTKLFDYLVASTDKDGCIIIETRQTGDGYKIEALPYSPDPQGPKDSQIAAATYNTLLQTTIYTRPNEPIVNHGSDPAPASIIGRPDLSGNITFPINSSNPDRTLTLEDSTGKRYEVTVPEFDSNTMAVDPNNPNRYICPSLDDLCALFNEQLNKQNTPPINIEFKSENNRLTIEGKNDIGKISIVGSRNTFYNTLLKGDIDVANKLSFTLNSSEKYVQGDTTQNRVLMDSTIIGNPLPAEIDINNGNDTLSFQVTKNGSTSTVNITLARKKYNSPQELISEINDRLERRGLSLEASLETSNNGEVRLKLTTLPTGDTGKITISANTSYNKDGSAWKIFAGTTKKSDDPQINNRSNGSSTSIQGVNDFRKYGVLQPIKITTVNNNFTLTFRGQTPIPITLDIPTPPDTDCEVDLSTLKRKVQEAIDRATRPDLDPTRKIHVSDAGGCLSLYTNEIGYDFFTISDDPNNDDDFYTSILGQKHETRINNPTTRKSQHVFDPPYLIGRAEIEGKNIEIIEDVNDTFTIDLTYSPSADSKLAAFELPLSLSITLPEGIYSSDDLVKRIQDDFRTTLTGDPKDPTDTGQSGKWVQQIKQAYKDYYAGLKEYENVDIDELVEAMDLDFSLTIDAGIGLKHDSAVVGIDDSKVMSFILREESGKAPSGTYKLDGVRGSAAYSIFYATTEKMEYSYAVGSKDISNGITFEPGKTEFSFKLDDEQFTYTFPEHYYSAQQFIDLLNDKFENGDPPNRAINMKASLENGCLKIYHKGPGGPKITDISGSAKGLVFYKEDERDDLGPFMLQVGALGHQGLELNRFRANTASLGINSVTISRVKYAEKALTRLDQAIDKLSTKRSTYGALQNRIDFLKSNNKNAAINIQASESKIRDANMATEMIEHVKNQLTTQASEAVLAQANQLPNRIANLLFQ